mgnify:CR=1 FL=1
MHAKENNQDQLLNQFKTEKTDIMGFLVNTFQIACKIENFDESSVTLFSQNKQHLIYKHAISTFTIDDGE